MRSAEFGRVTQTGFSGKVRRRRIVVSVFGIFDTRQSVRGLGLVHLLRSRHAKLTQVCLIYGHHFFVVDWLLE